MCKKITIEMCEKCVYCYNEEYCLLKEEYVEDLKQQECDSRTIKDKKSAKKSEQRGI